MTEKKAKGRGLKHGEAHIQFVAVLSEINELREAGYGIKAAYNKLKDAGKISMSYQAFHENFTRDQRPGKRGRKKRLEVKNAQESTAFKGPLTPTAGQGGLLPGPPAARPAAPVGGPVAKAPSKAFVRLSLDMDQMFSDKKKDEE